jgi:hypothetical protein
MIAGIYGMNFEHMPELKWEFGYPAVLLVIVAICSVLYMRFRAAGWLGERNRERRRMPVPRRRRIDEPDPARPPES